MSEPTPRIRLRKVTIKDFRGIDHDRAPPDDEERAGALAVIAGDNGVGENLGAGGDPDPVRARGPAPGGHGEPEGSSTGRGRRSSRSPGPIPGATSPTHGA